MKTLHIMVANKIAEYIRRDGDIVCGNSDYQIEFTFDSEWADHSEKKARFIWRGKFYDVPFVGNVCEVPIIKNADSVEVGVYAGELSTTTKAIIGCKRSILCGTESPHDAMEEPNATRAEEAADRAADSATRAYDSAISAENSETSARDFAVRAESAAQEARSAEGSKAEAEASADRAETAAVEAEGYAARAKTAVDSIKDVEVSTAEAKAYAERAEAAADRAEEAADRAEAAGGGSGGGGVAFTTDETLSLKNGVLKVNTADAPEEDNTLPITAAAVHTSIGNIDVLLQTI